MIQRIQSLFLFLASAGFFGQFATDFANSSAPIPQLMADQIYEVQDNPILLGITVLGGLLSAAAIFLYKNRNLQMKLSIFTVILAVLLPAAAAFLLYGEKTGIQSGVTINDTFGTYLPIASLVFGLLARNYINKDEKLVKSMDRLR